MRFMSRAERTKITASQINNKKETKWIVVRIA